MIQFDFLQFLQNIGQTLLAFVLLFLDLKYLQMTLDAYSPIPELFSAAPFYWLANNQCYTRLLRIIFFDSLRFFTQRFSNSLPLDVRAYNIRGIGAPYLVTHCLSLCSQSFLHFPFTLSQLNTRWTTSIFLPVSIGICSPSIFLTHFVCFSWPSATAFHGLLFLLGFLHFPLAGLLQTVSALLQQNFVQLLHRPNYNVSIWFILTLQDI